MQKKSRSGTAIRRFRAIAWPKLAAVAALCLASLALFSCDSRFVTVETGILPNLGFEQGFRYWAGSPDVTAFAGRDGVRIVLGDAGHGSISLLARDLTDPRRYSHIRVAADVRVENVAPGTRPWQRAGIILRSLDRGGRKLGYWPFEIALLEGTSDWQRYKAVIPVTAEAGVMRLYIYQAGKSGRMAVRHITIDAVAERRASKVARWVLIFLWIAAGVWIAAPLADRRRRHPAAYLAALTGVAILVLVLTPQPQLADTVKAVATRIDRIVASPPVEQAAEPRPGTPGGTTAGPREDESGGGATDVAGAAAGGSGNAARTAPISGPVVQRLAQFKVKTLLGVDIEGFGHLAVHAVFAFLVFLGFPGLRRTHLLVYLLTAGIATEVLQVFSITRTEHPVDGTMNLVGVLLGGAVFLVWRRFSAGRARTAAPDA